MVSLTLTRRVQADCSRPVKPRFHRRTLGFRPAIIGPLLELNSVVRFEGAGRVSDWCQFFSVLGGVVALPVVAHAQEKVRRVAMLSAAEGTDSPDVQARTAAFLQALQPLGWTVGRNLQIEQRSGAGDPALIRKAIAELVASRATPRLRHPP
jgi:hypothetical protein